MTARQHAEGLLSELATSVRDADVPGRLDDALDAASGVVQALVEQLPGQRRRRSMLVARAWLIGGAIVGAVLVTVGIAAWIRRRRAEGRAEKLRAAEDRAFDRAALDRATAEGMGPGTDPLPSPNGALHDGIVHDLPAVGELAPR